MSLNNGSIVSVVPTIEWKIVDGEAVLLDFKTGDYFSLNSVGTLLWRIAAERPVTLESLINHLSSEYTCTEAQALTDVNEWCEQMLKEKLLEVRN